MNVSINTIMYNIARIGAIICIYVKVLVLVLVLVQLILLGRTQAQVDKQVRLPMKLVPSRWDVPQTLKI